MSPPSAFVVLRPGISSHRRRRLPVTLLVGLLLLLSVAVVTQLPLAGASPDTFYLHDAATSGISPAGRYMNTTLGSGGANLTFDTVGQDAYWYTDQTFPTEGDSSVLRSGAYDLNMYFSQLPGQWDVQPPAVDAASNGSTATDTLTISHTTSGTNRLMLVGVSINNVNLETVSSITYNGTDLAFVGAQDHLGAGGDDSRVEIWKLVAPDTGTHDVVITFSADLGFEAVAGVVTFTGVDQASPVGPFAGNWADSASASVTISSASNDVALGVFACETCTSMSVDSPSVERWNVAVASRTFGAGGTRGGASPDVTVSATLGSSDHWAAAGVSVRPVGVSWWDTGYSYRARLTVDAGASSIPAGYPTRVTFDHASMVSQGKAQADGDDLRVLYWNGSAHTELGRVVANGSAWSDNATVVFFDTQASIAANETDNNYYLYYGNTSASSPPTGGVAAARFFLAESLGETQTSSTSYTSKLQLQFTPGNASEHWVVVATWRQRHVGDPGVTQFLGDARIRINGVARTGTDGIGYEQSGDAWMARSALFKLSGNASQQTVDLDFRAVGGTDAIDSARILAFLIPDSANADVQYAETLGVTTDAVNPTYAQNLSFIPASVGDYLWMANALHHEGPGGASTGGVEALDETGTVRQLSEETYMSSGEPFQTLAQFQVRALGQTSSDFARPDSDVSNAGGWTPTPLWAEIDETSPDDSTTMVTSGNSPTTADTFEVGLTNLADPQISSGHTIRFRARGDSGARDNFLEMEIRQGGTLIASTGVQDVTTAWTTFSYTLTASEADSIADYTDLRLRFIPDTQGTGGHSVIDVTWAELEVSSSRATFSLLHHPDTGSGSERKGLTQVLFRTDVFDAVETNSSEAESTTTETTYQLKNTLTTASRSSAQDHVYFAITALDHSGNDITNSSLAEHRLAGTQQIEADQAIDRGSYMTSVAWAYGEHVSGNRTIDTRFRTTSSGLTARIQYAQIVSLRYKEPATSLGVEQTADITVQVSVHHTKSDGTDPVEIVTSGETVLRANTSDPFTLNIGTGDQITFSSTDPRRLRLTVHVVNLTDGNNFILAFDSASDPSSLDTPTVGGEVRLTNPTLNPTSGTTSTAFNFTVDYSSPSGVAADVVKANVSDAANGTYNNLTMSPTQTPEVDYFVDESWALNGTIEDFANMQADQGSSATLVQEPGSETTPPIQEVSATADTTTTSTSYVLMDSMTLTPGAGDYLAVFSTSVSGDTAGMIIRVSIFVNGVQQAHTEREQLQESSITGTKFAIATHSHVSVGAGEAVELRWLVTAGTGTANKRTLNLLPVDAAAVSEASATADDSTSSSTYTLLNSMTLTPGAGDYLLLFSTSTDGASGTQPAFAVFVGGTVVQHTERTVFQESSVPDTEMPIFIAAHVTPGASDAVEIRWADQAAAGTVVAHERTLTLVETASTDIFEASSTTDTSATNTADALLSGMTVTPGAGDYLALFSDSHEYAAGVNADTFYSVYVAGTQEAESERNSAYESSMDVGTDLVAMTNGVVSPGASDAVEVQWRSSDGVTQRTSHERTLVLIRPAAEVTDTIFLAQFNTTGIRSSGEDTLVIQYNLTTADDTFGVWVWNFTASDWTSRGTLDQTATSFFNYTLTADEKGSGEVRIRLNDTAASGATNLTVDYQLVNNSLWSTGVTYFVNTTLPAGSYEHFFWANDTTGLSNRTAALPGPTVTAPPVVSNFRLETAAGQSRAGEQLDVDTEYFFLFNVTDENGWSDIGDDGNVSLRLWYDGNQTPELTYEEQTTGGNYRILLRYVDTSDPSVASTSEWSVVEGQATYNASASTATAISDGYAFNLSLRLGFQVKQAADPTDNATGDYNDPDSWNAEVVASDGSDTATLRTASTGEHMEFGVYMYTFVSIGGDWTTTVAPATSNVTNTVTVTYRSNDAFRMTLWFTSHLVGPETIDISNVEILAAADPGDNITTDTAFAGLGEANGVYVFGSATWWFNHSADADEDTVVVQFRVAIPLGTLAGTYTATLTIKVAQQP